MRTKRLRADQRVLDLNTGMIQSMGAESWNEKNLNLWTPDNPTEKALELLRTGEKNSDNRKQI